MFDRAEIIKYLQMVMERDLQLQERQMMAARERESEEAFEAMQTTVRAKARARPLICLYQASPRLSWHRISHFTCP